MSLNYSSEEEIFFGPISDKQKEKKRSLKGRRTEVYDFQIYPDYESPDGQNLKAMDSKVELNLTGDSASFEKNGTFCEITNTGEESLDSDKQAGPVEIVSYDGFNPNFSNISIDEQNSSCFYDNTRDVPNCSENLDVNTAESGENEDILKSKILNTEFENHPKRANEAEFADIDSIFLSNESKQIVEAISDASLSETPFSKSEQDEANVRRIFSLQQNCSKMNDNEVGSNSSSDKIEIDYEDNISDTSDSALDLNELNDMLSASGSGNPTSPCSNTNINLSHSYSSSDEFNDTIEEMEKLLKYGMKYFDQEGSVNGQENISKCPPCKPPRVIVTPSTPSLSTEINKNRYSKVSVNSVKEITPKKSPSTITPKKSPSTITPKKSPSTITSKKSPSSITPKKTSSARLIPDMTLSGKITPKKTPKSSKFSPLKSLNSKKSSSVKTLSRVKSLSKNFLTPQTQNLFKVPSQNILPTKLPTNHTVRHDIVSPVARYLKNNPPPPLITSVHPKNTLSAEKLIKHLAASKKPWGRQLPNVEKLNLTDSAFKRDDQLKKIDKTLQSLKSKVVPQPLLPTVKNQQTLKTPTKSTLAQHSYKNVEGFIVLENKENVCGNRRVIPDDLPTSVVKHKGRMTIPKNASVGSVGGGRARPECSLVDEESGRESQGNASLMEISVYETHAAAHTHTLHRN